jgi:hypothetical protein
MEKPGLSAEAIGMRMGGRSAREVRKLIKAARAEGEPITIGQSGAGYYYLDEAALDGTQRAAMVNHHRARTKSHLLSNAKLIGQIGRMTAVEVSQLMLFDLLIPAVEGEDENARPVSMNDLAALPVQRRAGMFNLFKKFLDAMENDPVAFAAERTVLADQYGTIFISKIDAQKLAQAKKLLEEVGI